MNTYKIGVVAGDGIGPEVIAEGVKVLVDSAAGVFKRVIGRAQPNCNPKNSWACVVNIVSVTTKINTDNLFIVNYFLYSSSSSSSSEADTAAASGRGVRSGLRKISSGRRGRSCSAQKNVTKNLSSSVA